MQNKVTLYRAVQVTLHFNNYRYYMNLLFRLATATMLKSVSCQTGTSFDFRVANVSTELIHAQTRILYLDLLFVVMQITEQQ